MKARKSAAKAPVLSARLRAAAARAIEEILTYSVASWSDVAAMLRFMGRWEPFDDVGERTRDGDMVTRTYRSGMAWLARPSCEGSEPDHANRLLAL
jgi:hypothetical protein